MLRWERTATLEMAFRERLPTELPSSLLVNVKEYTVSGSNPGRPYGTWGVKAGRLFNYRVYCKRQYLPKLSLIAMDLFKARRFCLMKIAERGVLKGSYIHLLFPRYASILIGTRLTRNTDSYSADDN
jgi:hypothetical protein